MKQYCTAKWILNAASCFEIVANFGTAGGLLLLESFLFVLDPCFLNFKLMYDPCAEFLRALNLIYSSLGWVQEALAAFYF
jgi:hypothetical protein